MSEPGSYKHESSKSPVRPTQETERYMAEKDKAPIAFNPDIHNADAPRLAWDRKKDDQISKKATPLYVHEVIESSQFLKQLQRNPDLQLKSSLFEDLEDDAVYEWYKHQGNWMNRLIHGDSASVMASLAAKEHLVGKVQMVYYDPPYGISFNSTMQVDASSRTSGDKKEAVSPEPEMVRVFRDTYKRGIHDYLDSIRENVVLARSLLAETGSFFLQIGAQNVHRLAVLLDEIFGAENRIATITFAKTAASSSKNLSEVADYLLWYSKSKKRVKYYDIFKDLTTKQEVIAAMSWHAMVELSDGTSRNLTNKEKLQPELLPRDSRLFIRKSLLSQGWSTTGRSEAFSFNGKQFHCNPNSHWSVSHEGLGRLAELNRLATAENVGQLTWKRYDNEMAGTKIHNVWEEKNAATDMHYVVETAEKVIAKCLLMSTDPGDLVLDITCGSGTTPFVCEKWGRRWIAIDASRIPIALARQRVLSSVHDWFVLADSTEGVLLESKYRNESPPPGNEEAADPASGFVYERVPYVSAATLAYDRPPSFTLLVDKPHKRRGVKRIASPFTVESLSPYRSVSPDEFSSVSPDSSQDGILDALRVAGCPLKSRGRVSDFSNFESMGSEGRGFLTHRCDAIYPSSESSENELQITGVALSILPEDATCSASWISRATHIAAADQSIGVLLIIAFNFESDALESDRKRGRLNVHCVRANRDLMIDSLELSKTDHAFVEIGEPDILVSKCDQQLSVEVLGYDTFNPKTGNLAEGTSNDIQCWMIDTNYDQKQFFARRFHFPNKSGDRQIKRFQSALKKYVDNDEWKAMLSMKSTPFPPPATKLIAIRIITNTGVEMTKVVDLSVADSNEFTSST